MAFNCISVRTEPGSSAKPVSSCLWTRFTNSSGGRTGGDTERFQRGPGGLFVQRQSEHEGWGARVRDGHQVDQTGPQHQSAGSKTPLWCHSALHQNCTVSVSWDKKPHYLWQYRCCTSAEPHQCNCSTDSVCLLREAHSMKTQTSDSSFHLGGVHQLCASDAALHSSWSYSQERLALRMRSIHSYTSFVCETLYC